RDLPGAQHLGLPGRRQQGADGAAQPRAVGGEVEREQEDGQQLEQSAEDLRGDVQDAGGAVLDVVAQPVGAQQALLDVHAAQFGVEVGVDPVDDRVEI